MVLIHNRQPRMSKLTLLILLLIVLISFRYFFKPKPVKEFSLVCPYTLTIVGKKIIFDEPSYSINHYPEFICPQNFRNMADWIYGWPKGVFNETIETSVNKIDKTVSSLPHGSIIYVKTDSLPDFFYYIYPYFRHKFVLITAQGDQQAPGKHLYYLQKKNSKIIHWFGQNADIDASTNERFTHIPIGKKHISV